MFVEVQAPATVEAPEKAEVEKSNEQKAADLLLETAELLGQEGRWTQGNMARDVEGIGIHANSRFAHSFCLIGGIDHTRHKLGYSGYIRMVAVNALGRAIRSNCRTAEGTVMSFNDNDRRKQETVVKKLRVAAHNVLEGL